jgi:hypothetical protein
MGVAGIDFIDENSGDRGVRSHRIGHLDPKDMERVNQAILIFLGLGG